MTWSLFIWFAAVAVLLWAAGAVCAWKGRLALVYTFTLAGIAVFFAFILGMWISMERPPLRTMGETRLWYSFFLPVAGIIVYSRWRYKWILTFSTLLSVVFICVNLFKPEIHSKALMPALQSPWFAPHVIVYMFSYALLGAATVMAVYLLFFKRLPAGTGMTKGGGKPGLTVVGKPGMAGEDFELEMMKKGGKPGMMAGGDVPGLAGDDAVPATTSDGDASDTYGAVAREMNIADNLVYVGVAFLTIGMLFGALWAKAAWGDYWTWDPKETWAAATWLAYLVYIHLRKARPRDWQMACTVLLIAFICLQLCWWGVNYLPSARGNSVHTY